MVTTYARAEMAKKIETDAASGPRRKTSPVHITADLAKKLAVISQHRNRSVTALVDPLIKNWVEIEYAKAIREMAKELEG